MKVLRKKMTIKSVILQMYDDQCQYFNINWFIRDVVLKIRRYDKRHIIGINIIRELEKLQDQDKIKFKVFNKKYYVYKKLEVKL